MLWLWRFFPVFYTLPFVAATLAIEPVAEVGSVLRWVVLGMGAATAVFTGFRRGPGRAGDLAAGDVVCVAFLLLFLASCQWSIAPAYTLQRTVSVALLYVTSMWALWRWVDHFSDDLLLAEILYTLAACLAVNLGLGLVFVRDQLASVRFQGVFENPNNIGMITALCVPLALARALSKRRLIDWVVLGIFVTSLVACGSRTSLLASVSAATLLVLFGLVRNARLALFFAGAMAAGLLLLSQTAYFHENILRQTSLETMSNRKIFWDLATTEYIPERPRLGHGFGSDRDIHDYYGNVLSDLKLRGYGVMSSYYGLAVQIGVPATVVFFGLLWGATIRGLLRFHGNWRFVMSATTVISGLIACIAESAIYSAGNCFAFLFWTVFMLTLRNGRELSIGIALRQATARAQRRKTGVGQSRPTSRPRNPWPSKTPLSTAVTYHARPPLHGQS